MNRTFQFLVIISALVIITAGCGGSRSRSAPGTAKRWHIIILFLDSEPGCDETRQGILEGLHSSGLREGIDYDVKQSSAQGDISMLNMLVDGALTDGADLMIAVSTPVLQAAIQRGRHVPTVFDYVANPIIAGAGESDRRHLPWVTGVYIMSDFSGMISAIKECNIGVRRIGTLFCPAEINSVYFRDELVKAAQNDGFDVVSVPANTSGDMPDAAMALCGRNIDAICQISDNLSSAGFSSVVKAANQAHLPLFVFQSKQAESGAVLAIARDFIDAGRSTGAMAARIVRGTSPAQIPFQHSNATKIIINMDAARRLNMKIPQSLLSRASQVFSQ